MSRPDDTDAARAALAGWEQRVRELLKGRDEARAIARRLAHSIIEYDGPPSPAQADALIAWDALPWAQDDA